MPDFRHPDFLQDHIRHTMAFYHPRCIDASGGFYQFFKDDGTIYDATTRHLVSSTRFVFNYAMAYKRFGDPAYQAAARHGVEFLRRAHRNPVTGGYIWQLAWENGQATPQDETNHCYGLAFVLLAYAQAYSAGIEEARAWIDETWLLMETRFWEPQHGLYADEASADWQVSNYRGQNANMHACEAMLTAFEATGDSKFLDRAEVLARNITERQAALAGNLIWEHYDQYWQVDWHYNRHDKTNIFRPWGYQPGHLVEWAKLLLILERHRPAAWLLPRAEQLFSEAVERAWDAQYGGLVYGVGPEMNESGPCLQALGQTSFCDGDKYFWVQAEALAAAAVLATRTGQESYWQWYDKLWDYSWQHLVDHRYGGWYRILSQANEKYSDEKSPAGKVDYHTMGACYEVLGVLNVPPAPGRLPLFVSAGEALTDLIRIGGEQWASKTGGAGWNAARVMASLGVPSAFAGSISRDCFGTALWQASEAAGLDMRFMLQADKPPLLAIVHETNPPQYFFVGTDSADLAFNTHALPAGWMQAARWVHFGGISLTREPLAGKLLALARELKAAGVNISYDPNYRVAMTPAYDATLAAMCQLADVIKVSDEDLAGLFRTDDLAAAFAKLRNFNPDALVLYTRGAEGAALFAGDEAASMPALEVSVVDTVGAGDASIAGLIYSLIHRPEDTLLQRLKFAVAAGAAACQQAGATPPTLAQVQGLLGE